MPSKQLKSIVSKSPADESPHLFTCKAPNAKQVFLAGDFNEWSTQATPMERSPDGEWMVALTLPVGSHEYKFVVDGAWCCEPGCEGSMAQARCSMCVANEHGTMNRVVEVK